MKDRQQIIDDCRHAVQGVWLDYVAGRRQGAEQSMALEVAIAHTREHVTNAVNAAVEIARRLYHQQAADKAAKPKETPK